MNLRTLFQVVAGLSLLMGLTRFVPLGETSSSACRLPLVCSHRGAGATGHQVGSLDAIRALVDAGITCFDVDVCTSKDAVLFVSHPGHLRTVLGLGDGSDVSEYTWTQLKTLAAKVEEGPFEIPKLREIFDLLLELRRAKKPVQISLELKGPAINSRTLQEFVSQFTAAKQFSKGQLGGDNLGASIAVILPPGKGLEKELQVMQTAIAPSERVRSAVGLTKRLFGDFVDYCETDLDLDHAEKLKRLASAVKLAGADKQGDNQNGEIHLSNTLSQVISEFDLWMPPVSMLCNNWLQQNIAGGSSSSSASSASSSDGSANERSHSNSISMDHSNSNSNSVGSAGSAERSPQGMAVWIVDDEKSARLAVEFGAGSIITNEPLKLQKILHRLSGAGIYTTELESTQRPEQEAGKEKEGGVHAGSALAHFPKCGVISVSSRSEYLPNK